MSHLRVSGNFCRDQRGVFRTCLGVDIQALLLGLDEEFVRFDCGTDDDPALGLLAGFCRKFLNGLNLARKMELAYPANE
jgi:hypothetical protein